MITVSTTTMRVRRQAADPSGPDGLRDPWDPPPGRQPSDETVEVLVRATVSKPSLSYERDGSTWMGADVEILLDACDVAPDDVLVDETTGESWSVVAVLHRHGVGRLTHVRVRAVQAR